MAAVALIKLAQGALTADAGVALQGTKDGGEVTVTNGDNLDVVEWSVWLLDAPSGSTTFPESSLPQLIASDQTPVPLAALMPDAGGSYRLLLDVKDALGQVDRDIRCFGVPDPYGFIKPACQKYPAPLPTPAASGLTDAPRPEKPDEQNYGRQSRGWAGSGQLDTFFERQGQLPPTRIATNDYSIPLGAAPLYLCDLPAVDEAMVVRLPAGAPLGFVARLGALGPSEHRATVVPPGADTIGELASLVIASGSSAQVVHTEAGRWEVLGGEDRVTERTLLAGLNSASTTVWTTVGATFWEPEHALTDVTSLRALLFTSDPAVAAEARLFHTSSGNEVASSLLSTVSGLPTAVVREVQLTEGEGIYELQLRRSAGAGATAFCLGAGLTVKEYRS